MIHFFKGLNKGHCKIRIEMMHSIHLYTYVLYMIYHISAIRVKPLCSVLNMHSFPVTRNIELTDFKQMLLPHINQESVTGILGRCDTTIHVEGQLALSYMPVVHKCSTCLNLMFLLCILSSGTHPTGQCRATADHYFR